ncbi:MAG TPA: TIR domain-containing protein [Opitutaceae bacterium]|jgi:hypothetical protein|nr:TIR domain-containing protein [Opitutaceae bacterium]
MAKRVFFSFHYQDVIDFRANVVRNHWITKDDHEEAGYFDASLWEASKKTGDESLKRLINGGLDETTVTSVLIGSQTYARRWVRYEIFKSLSRGNRLFGVHINCIPGKDRQTKLAGPNPFEYLAVRFAQDGKSVELFEWDGQKWIAYTDLRGWSFPEAKDQSVRGQVYQLKKWYSVYDWNTNSGYDNFPTWVGE